MDFARARTRHRADKEARAGSHDSAKWYTVFMFAATTALLFADQSLLSPNLMEAQASFGFTDRQKDELLAGMLPAGFFLVGAPAAVLVGYLMDQHDRVRLLLSCVLLGEVPCMATVWVTRFWQLLVSRMLTGIAIGGAAPIIYGLLSDLFPPSQRAYVTTCIVLSQGAGVALGQAVAGAIPGMDWRMPFLIVSVPTVLLALVMAWTTHDPQRGAAEPALREAAQLEGYFYDEHLTWRKCLELATNKTNLLVISQGLPGCLPWGVVLVFLNDHLQTRGLPKAAATLLVMSFGAGGLLGSLVAGVAGQLLYNWRKSALPVFTGLSVWAGMPALFVLINSGAVLRWHRAALVVFSFLGGSVASIAGVVIRPLLMNVNTPEARGIALAFQATLDDVGKGLGPALVAVLISVMNRFAPHGESRVMAFNVAIAGWVPCGLLLILAGLTLPGDEARVQRQMARLAARLQPADEGFLVTSAMEGLATPAMSAAYTDAGPTPTGAMRAALELGVLRQASGASGFGQPADARLPSIEHAALPEDAPLLLS